MEEINNNKYFSWADAWVFTSLYFTIKDEKIIDLSEIIGAGDVLNHSIMNEEEIKTAFIKLQKRGIIQIVKDRIKFTSLGKSIIEKAEKARGGLFSRVDISLQKLNSSRVKLPFIEGINDCAFITKDNVLKAYQNYANKIKG